MNDQPVKSGVSSGQVVFVFFVGLVLGLFIGAFGGPMIERYFGADASKTPLPVTTKPSTEPRDRELRGLGPDGKPLTPTPAPTPPTQDPAAKPTEPGHTP